MASFLKSVCQATLLVSLCLSGVYAGGEADRYFDLAGDAYKNKDYSKATQYFQKAAEMGSASASNNLGVMYRAGQGVEKDYEKALKYFQKAAEMGDAKASNNLGVMYKVGQGVV
ncbi:tetratricopeptide repeat protein [Helicobacter sp. NHP22-001]|nr:tetratricopeptide repeat protein [Helicobacter sp. NHP22-001]GMB96864.1 hypothetical protein NHP22001_14530 [Helicobacter sp. NHP22-001]